MQRKYSFVADLKKLFFIFFLRREGFVWLQTTNHNLKSLSKSNCLTFCRINYRLVFSDPKRWETEFLHPTIICFPDMGGGGSNAQASLWASLPPPGRTQSYLGSASRPPDWTQPLPKNPVAFLPGVQTNLTDSSPYGGVVPPTRRSFTPLLLWWTPHHPEKETYFCRHKTGWEWPINKSCRHCDQSPSSSSADASTPPPGGRLSF